VSGSKFKTQRFRRSQCNEYTHVGKNRRKRRTIYILNGNHFEVLCVCIMHPHTCVNTDLLVKNVGKIRLGALDVICCNLNQRPWLLTTIVRSRARWDSAVPLVLSTRVSTLRDDVAHGWDPAACAASSDWDGIMLASAMAERAPGTHEKKSWINFATAQELFF